MPMTTEDLKKMYDNGGPWVRTIMLINCYENAELSLSPFRITLNGWKISMFNGCFSVEKVCHGHNHKLYSKKLLSCLRFAAFMDALDMPGHGSQVFKLSYAPPAPLVRKMATANLTNEPDDVILDES